MNHMRKLQVCKKGGSIMPEKIAGTLLFIGLIGCMNETDAWWINIIGIFVFAAGAFLLSDFGENIKKIIRRKR